MAFLAPGDTFIGFDLSCGGHLTHGHPVNFSGKTYRAVFPGNQGGPHDHITAAKAVALKEALSPDFKHYTETIIANAKILAGELTGRRITLVTGGTDNHMILINLLPFGNGLGRSAAVALKKAGIVSNANTVPFDPSIPFKPSGIRIGTPAVTTRGLKENEMAKIGAWIASIVRDQNNGEATHL